MFWEGAKAFLRKECVFMVFGEGTMSVLAAGCHLEKALFKPACV